MHFFRKLLDHKKLTSLLLFGLLMRSLIASGFMVDANPSDGGLFSIIICDGPAGVNAIADNSKNSQQHEHHHEHESDEHNHEAQDHGFSACSFWSSSSQTLLANVLFLDLADARLSDEIIVYQSQFIHNYTNNARLARAPPTLS